MKGNRLRYAFILLVALLVIGGVFALRSGGEELEAVRLQSQDLTEVIALSGRVHGRVESRLAFEVSGRVQQISVQEGESVEAGQVLARLEPDVFEAQVAQAEAAVGVAEQQLRVASRPPLESEFDELRAETARERRVAEADLESARQQLLEAEEGPRIEQVEQARAQRDQAQADLEQTQRDLVRNRELLSDGAVSRQTYEQAETAYQTALAAFETAEARVRELENGTRPEELERARQALRSAQADLEAAREAGEARLQQLADSPRPEDVALAESQRGEAQAALRLAREQLEQSVLRAPYDGVVGLKLLREGDQSGPNDPVLTLSSRPALEVRVDLDESDLPRLQLGQQAMVRARGYLDEFQVEVQESASEVDPIRGTLEVRLWSDSMPDWLRPGQTVDVNLILAAQRPRLVVPLTAVQLRGAEFVVTVVTDGKAERRSVSLTGPVPEGYLVQSGLQEDEVVLLYPQDAEDGQTVKVQETS